MLPRSYPDFSALDLKDLYKAKGGQGEELDPHFVDGEKESYRRKMSSQAHHEGPLYLMKPQPCSCATCSGCAASSKNAFFQSTWREQVIQIPLTWPNCWHFESRFQPKYLSLFRCVWRDTDPIKDIDSFEGFILKPVSNTQILPEISNEDFQMDNCHELVTARTELF